MIIPEQASHSLLFAPNPPRHLVAFGKTDRNGHKSTSRAESHLSLCIAMLNVQRVVPSNVSPNSFGAIT